MNNLARVLATFGQADQVASSLSGALAVSPLLTSAEQRLYGETIQRQEREHSRLSLGWAARLGWTGGGMPSSYAATVQRDTLILMHLRDVRLQTAWILADLRWNEEQGLRGFERWARFLDGIGYAEIARDIRLIDAEEREHVAANRRITARLAAQDADFRRMERLAYRLTRAACSPALSRSAKLPKA